MNLEGQIINQGWSRIEAGLLLGGERVKNLRGEGGTGDPRGFLKSGGRSSRGGRASSGGGEKSRDLKLRKGPSARGLRARGAAHGTETHGLVKGKRRGKHGWGSEKAAECFRKGE